MLVRRLAGMIESLNPSYANWLRRFLDGKEEFRP
jgi:hypothetical protein